MQIKTVTTTDGITTVDFGNTADKFYWIKNVGTTTVYASTKSDVAAGADGTAEITAGSCAMLENYDSIVYISGAGKVEIHETNNDVCPFKFAAAGNSEDISAIQELIPAAASAGNQLTDKAYVDSGLSGKADKSDTYTKTETDSKITEKVAEIVADAPDDFNTLKEMSDWIATHEGSAAEMNSAIQTNTSNILNLQAGKVDKETGKSLVSDSEIERLSTLENYTLPTATADTLGGVKIGEGLTIKDGVLSASGGGLGNLKIAYGLTEDITDKDYVLDYSSAGFTQVPTILTSVFTNDDWGKIGEICCKKVTTTNATFNKAYRTSSGLTYLSVGRFFWLAIGV